MKFLNFNIPTERIRYLKWTKPLEGVRSTHHPLKSTPAMLTHTNLCSLENLKCRKERGMGGKRGWEEIGIEREQGVRGNGGFERYRRQKEKSMKGKTCKTLI